METKAMNDEIKALRKTLAWMDLVLANLSESVFVVDKDWKITFVNKALADLVGELRIILLGKYVWEVVPITRGETSLKTQIKNEKLSIKNAELLNGVYKLGAFKTSRIMELNCTYIPKLQQAACVLTDTTLETRALKQLHKLSKSNNN